MATGSSKNIVDGVIVDEAELFIAMNEESANDDEAVESEPITKVRKKSKAKKSKKRVKKSKKSAKKKSDDDSTTPEDLTWRRSLLRHPKSGALLQVRANAHTILKNHPSWEGVLAYNAFTDRVVFLKEPRWHRHDRPAKTLQNGKRSWTDDDTALTAAWLEREEGLSLPGGIVAEAARVVGRTGAYHPLRDRLLELAALWDGIGRLDTWLIRHAKVKNTPYSRAVSSKWLISLVARAFQPGCQVDHVLILEGEQGGGKTSLFRDGLCFDKDLFMETKMDIGEKDALQAIRSKWMIAIDEIDSMSKHEASDIKSFLTIVTDTYRKSYGRETADNSRQCVFLGTTNKYDGYLNDPTGARRFWPLRTPCTEIDRTNIAGLLAERDQLWAEAVVRYQAGEPWHLTDPQIIVAARKEQAARSASDPWEGAVRKYLIESNAKEEGASTVKILEDLLDFRGKDIDKRAEMRVSGILRSLGYARDRCYVNGKQVRRYFPVKPKG